MQLQQSLRFLTCYNILCIQNVLKFFVICFKKQRQSSEQVILSDALILWLFNVCKLTIEWLPSTFFVTYRIGFEASSLYGL